MSSNTSSILEAHMEPRRPLPFTLHMSLSIEEKPSFRTGEGESVEQHRNASLPRGVGFALLAAPLFGASTPFAKLLLGSLSPLLLAGLLYLGSGSGLSLLYLFRRTR